MNYLLAIGSTWKIYGANKSELKKSELAYHYLQVTGQPLPIAHIS